MDYLNLVEELNQEMYETFGETDELWFYTSSGCFDIIGFGNITLWDSENDDRSYDENENIYEPFKPYLKNKLKEYGQLLSKIAE